MKILKTRICDPLGNDFELKHESLLDKYLDLPYSHWSNGSGDSAILKDNTDGLMFFKFDTNAFFVMELSSYLSPIQNQNDIEWIKHHVGGEPFHFSSRFVCSKKTLSTILTEYSKSGEKRKNFIWSDPLPDEELYLKLQEQKQN
ncbi:hypothetical protein [Winogradskyella sp.]|uniref:hypothetical protein n=1 Tax=Winogradskyella sp. TaxID=1883156 RepID=UPI003BADB789